MIQVEHLTKRYGLLTAIKDVTFEVNKGEILGFLGAQRRGKDDNHAHPVGLLSGD